MLSKHTKRDLAITATRIFLEARDPLSLEVLNDVQNSFASLSPDQETAILNQVVTQSQKKTEPTLWVGLIFLVIYKILNTFLDKILEEVASRTVDSIASKMKEKEKNEKIFKLVSDISTDPSLSEYFKVFSSEDKQKLIETVVNIVIDKSRKG